MRQLEVLFPVPRGPMVPGSVAHQLGQEEAEKSPWPELLPSYLEGFAGFGSFELRNVSHLGSVTE